MSTPVRFTWTHAWRTRFEVGTDKKAPLASHSATACSHTSRTQARPEAPLGRILAKASGDREALDALYLMVLSRKPNPKELEVVGEYLGRA